MTYPTSVPCSTCAAPIGRSCRGPAGSNQQPHVARLIAAGLRPRCSCGQQLPPSRQKWCDECRARAVRDTRRAASDRYRAKHKPPARVSARGVCGSCGRVLHVRGDGLVRLHRGDDHRACPGSRRPAEQVAA